MIKTNMTQLEFFREWCSALRRGEFVQGRSALHTITQGVPSSDKYCCLGVACVVAVRHDMLARQLIAHHDTYSYMPIGSDRDIYWAHMPFNLANWLEIEQKEQVHLAKMNDNGQPFSVIAGWIEQNLMVRFEE